MPEIIYFLPDTDAGVASVVRNLLKYRSDFENKYKVILTRLNGAKNKQVIKYDFHKAEKIVFNYHSYENIYSVFDRLKKYITNDKTIIVANDGLELRMINALQLRNPVVYIVHGDFSYYYNLVAQFQNSMDQIITVSSLIKQHILQKSTEIDDLNVKFVPYPVEEIRIEKQNFNLNEPVKLVFIGSLVQRKGVQLLPMILKGILDKGHNAHLFVAGDGPLIELLNQNELINERITLLGHITQEEITDYLTSSDFLLLPSFSEGLPNVVIEAMKCGCIPVVSDLESGIPDIIDEGLNGFTAKTGDVDDFVNTIVKVIKRKDIPTLRQNAIDSANIKFDPYHQALKYQSLILNTSCKTDKRFNNKRPGGILNQKWLPNILVKKVRALNLSPKL